MEIQVTRSITQSVCVECQHCDLPSTERSERLGDIQKRHEARKIELGNTPEYQTEDIDYLLEQGEFTHIDKYRCRVVKHPVTGEQVRCSVCNNFDRTCQCFQPKEDSCESL